MGKLNIAHHKSYHPYRRDNIERVRQDEEEERLKEEREDGRMRLADSEARIDLLRTRAGVKKVQKRPSKEKDDDLDFEPRAPIASTSATSLPDTLQTPEGHINLFAPLEAAAASHAAESALLVIREHAKSHKGDATGKGRKGAAGEDDGFRLAPSKLDLKPWYVDEELRTAREREEGTNEREVRRAKDLSSKLSRDPMTEVNAQLLARRAREKGSGLFASGPTRQYRPTNQPTTASTASTSSAKAALPADPAVATRLARESAERQRALLLIERKRHEAASEYASSVASTPRDGYRDAYNLDAVREAEARRRERAEGFDRDRAGDRVRYWRAGAEDERRAREREGARREVDVGRIRDRRW